MSVLSSSYVFEYIQNILLHSANCSKQKTKVNKIAFMNAKKFSNCALKENLLKILLAKKVFFHN